MKSFRWILACTDGGRRELQAAIGEGARLRRCKNTPGADGHGSQTDAEDGARAFAVDEAVDIGEGDPGVMQATLHSAEDKARGLLGGGLASAPFVILYYSSNTERATGVQQ